ncbi:MAG: hypothetical protein R3D80_12260 [Paracoccaceae bacterium]
MIDQMALPEAVAIEPPQFSVEMLRNEAGISLIGLIPAATDREALTRRMRAIDPVQPVADFLETAEFPTPEGWDNALDFALEMAAMLPRSKISLSADSVTVEAIATAPDQKREWERVIRRERPAGLRLALDIRAPLDVISPYTLRFLSDDQGARFDACTAYTTAGRNKIISAGIAAGVKGTVDCTIGLGVPSPDWPDAVARSIQAVRDMGGGALTFSDADISLIAAADTPQDTFDRVVGELEADLPEVFSLHSVLSEPETGPASPAGIPEFTASLAESGAVSCAAGWRANRTAPSPKPSPAPASAPARSTRRCGSIRGCPRPGRCAPSPGSKRSTSSPRAGSWCGPTSSPSPAPPATSAPRPRSRGCSRKNLARPRISAST